MQSIGQLVRNILSELLLEISMGRSLADVSRELDNRIIASL